MASVSVNGPLTPLIMTPALSQRSLIVAMDGYTAVSPFGVSSAPAFSGTAKQAADIFGRGVSVAGSASKVSFGVGSCPKLAGSTPFTLEFLCRITAASNTLGVIDYGTASIAGDMRAVGFFGGGNSRNIYFWGNSADLSSSVDGRADGSLQHIFVTSQGAGTTMTFYRDGLSIASGTTPTLTTMNTVSFSMGSGNGGTAPTGSFYKAAIYARAFTASEVWQITQDPWADFRSLPSDRRTYFANSIAADTLMGATWV